MSIEKTFIIYCNEDELRVGSIVALRSYLKNSDSTYYWLSKNGLVKNNINPSEPKWDNDTSYRIYCKDNYNKYKKFGEKINMNDTIGLYCMSEQKFLSINPNRGNLNISFI